MAGLVIPRMFLADCQADNADANVQKLIQVSHNQHSGCFIGAKIHSNCKY